MVSNGTFIWVAESDRSVSEEAAQRRAIMVGLWPGLAGYVRTAIDEIFIDVCGLPRQFSINVQTSMGADRITGVYHSYGWSPLIRMDQYDGRTGLGWDGRSLIGDETDWTVAMCDYGVPGVLRGVDLESVREDVERINSTMM